MSLRAPSRRTQNRALSLAVPASAPQFLLAVLAVAAALNWRRLLWPGAGRDASIDAPLPPGNLGCPLLGSNFLAATKEYGPGIFFRKRSEELGHPRVWKFFFAGLPFAAVSGGANVMKVLGSEFETPGVASRSLPSIEATMGKENIMLAKSRREHGFLRALVGQATAPAVAAAMVPELQEAAGNIMEDWASAKTAVVAAAAARRFTQDVAWKNIVGLKLTEQEAQEFRVTVSTWEEGVVTPIPLKIPGSPFAKSMRCKAELTALIRRQMQIVAGAADGEAPTRPSVLRALVKARDDEGAALTEQQIIDNTLLLIFAGSETASSTLAILVLLLGLHPDVYAKVRAEVLAVVQERGQQMTDKFLSACTYLDAVVREAMRIKPVSSGGSRVAKDTLLIDGMQVPKGWSVAFSVTLTHELDPLTFQEDYSHMDLRTGFKPERWLSEATRPTTEYLPFGAGPRRCIGASLAMVEVKTFIAELARRFEALELEDPEISWRTVGFVPKPANGVPVRVRATG